MIIVGDRIVAARCQLPMTARRDIPAHYGMRHRAAIGVTEDTDADVVVVSEETGNVSYVHGGEIQTIKNIEELRSILAHTLLAKEEA
jgi:DNA integrity scanning protein DisA with diadenylate cyclase activity